MSPITWKPIIIAAMRSQFESAANAFLLSQSGENFGNLEKAMWALQYANQKREEEMNTVASSIGVGRLVDYFADQARKTITY